MCPVIQVPVKSSIRKGNTSNLFSLLSAMFDIQLHVSEKCQDCHGKGGLCFSKDEEGFYCREKKENKRGSILKWVLGTVILGGILLVLCFLILVIYCRKKWKHASSYASTKNTSSGPSSNADLGGSIAYFGVPLFSYDDLEEATNNFSPSEELGDGGFGTVYHGKLRDGRDVAVKRLYEHNYKRMTQFTNEIKILTRLSHPNLVSLYGCTSSRSRELLLVYEYVANGTVADHLYGARANDRCLSWPIRMNIAMETASALAYLHASDIVHRDVKTNNILIDLNFHVKVADFGLSRLFPIDVTHISTAPQGTPGYVDPEYHQCYQLTDKSDVYSFGVVLIELISSKPAVDITRHKHEINLANYAMNRIQNRAFHELIDPSVGLESDSSTEWMVMAVAEVAFRCLQLEKELRPTMKEILEALKDIRDHKEGDTEGSDKVGKSGRARALSEGDDDIVLLKNSKAAASSPDSVTEKWLCCSSTSFSSG
ncbi:Non-specific serine/threonine protein kinase [Bertholletia excelsa]